MERFDLELAPGMNPNYFARKKGKLQALSFTFEGDKEPRLRHIGFYWKN